MVFEAVWLGCLLHRKDFLRLAKLHRCSSSTCPSAWLVRHRNVKLVGFTKLMATWVARTCGGRWGGARHAVHLHLTAAAVLQNHDDSARLLSFTWAVIKTTDKAEAVAKTILLNAECRRRDSIWSWLK